MFCKVVRFLLSTVVASSLILTPVFAAEGPSSEPQGKLDLSIKKGDIDNDGDLDAEDALEGLRVITEIYDRQEFHDNNGDINGDGKMSVRDAFMLLQNLVGLRDDKLGYKNAAPEITYKAPEAYAEGSEFLSAEKPLAFYGADGWGKYTTGGRRGKVIEVWNLNDSGEGSLRAAVEASGPRIIVFKVSGVIYLNKAISISRGDVTIAGETAPGDGITLANYGMSISAENVIVRYLSIRPGDHMAQELDGIDICGAKNVVVDHCSVSFATDETLSARPNGNGASYNDVSDNVSVQWCMISESITESSNIGSRHGMGSLIRGAQGAKITYHHNMYTSHSSRLPMMGNYMGSEYDDGNFSAEFINNIVYNWSGESASKCADADEDGIEIHISRLNYINNYYKQGPVSSGNILFSEGSIGNQMYISGNMMDGVLYENQRELVEFTNDILAHKDNPYYDTETQTGLVIDAEKYFLSERFENSLMADIDSAETVGEEVAAYAGNSLSRDCFDTSLVADYENGEGQLIDHTFESTGWYKGTPESKTGAVYKNWIQGKYPNNASYPGYVDTDKDGMSDAWEDAMELDKNESKDGSASYKGSEYTNLDVFLQFLVENPEAAIQY